MKKALLALIILLILFGFLERQVIFQEGNPIPVVVGIFKLSVKGQTLAQISEEPEKYLIKNKDGYGAYIEYMEAKGWKYVEQMGAGLVFEKDKERHISVSRMLTRYYIVIRY